MKKNTLFVQNIFYSLLFVIGLIIVWLFWGIYSDKPPRFFPLNSDKGTYVITKNCPDNFGWDEEVRYPGSLYCVEYTGPDVLLEKDGHKDGFYRINVGNSDVDLALYVGKEVINLSGKFNRSNRQCILDLCTKLPGNYIVLDIKSFEEKR